MTIRTHSAIDPHLCGEPVSLSAGAAEVALTAGPEMVVDRHGLVHGGFVFGLADHAAMLAVNEANVVLVQAEVRFIAPVEAGDRMVARARRRSAPEESKRPVVEVDVTVGERTVFSGTFHCAVPSRHVLELDREEGEAAR